MRADLEALRLHFERSGITMSVAVGCHRVADLDVIGAEIRAPAAIWSRQNNVPLCLTSAPMGQT